MEQIDWTWIWLGQGVAWYLGYKFGQHRTAVKFTQMLLRRDPELERNIERARQEIARLEAGTDTDHEELRVERHGEQIYIYTKNNNEFLAQGSSLQECLERIEQRFPGRNFRGLLSKEQADELGISVK